MRQAHKLRLCAISVDLDEIPHYRGLYGLALRSAGTTAVYDRSLDRFAAFAREHALPLTFFAVGQDLARVQAAERTAALVRAGHAVENHSHSHRYDLGRQTGQIVHDEIALAHDAIARATGRAPSGFRAPGYGLSNALLDELERLGYQYDSSAFPCPAYYATKAAKMAGLWARGRSTVAVLGPLKSTLGPMRPYRPSQPWYRAGGTGLVELPMQVTPRLRLPVIGQILTLAGRSGARLLVRACAHEPLVNLELHGIDLLDAGDGLEDVAAVQADVRLPLDRKLGVLGAVVDELRAHGYRFVRLDEAAHVVAEAGVA